MFEVTRARINRLAVCSLISVTFLGCSDSNRVDIIKEDRDLSGGATMVATAREADIGDVSYSNFALLRLADASKGPNIENKEVTSPRFEGRVISVEINVASPHPENLQMNSILGARRRLPDHTVYHTIHVYREIFSPETKSYDREEIFSYSEIWGDRIGESSHTFDAFVGLDTLPETMLLSSELEAWLFLYTEPTTFDPETADFDAVETLRYQGSNPARINIIQ